MKKLLLFLSMIFSLIIFTVSESTSGGLNTNPKKMACETSCNSSYDQCIAAGQKKADKIQNEDKKQAQLSASQLSCQASKDKCMSKCK